MIKNILLATALFASIGATAQTIAHNARVQQYILQYNELAKAEQQRAGIPAAITLAQGILETEAGNSELATLANNHFGIKCKKDWTGETFAHDDDAPQECFRKYPTALQSYEDHSDYLKASKRYQPCFAQDKTDYAAWARELSKCGYATNPKYAQKLIRLIEDFHLQDYTYAALNNTGQPALVASAASPAAAAMMTEKATAGEVVPERDTPAPGAAPGDEKPVYGQVIRKDGLKGFYAHKGDVLLEYAIQYKVRYAKLLEINGLPDAPLAADMFVFIEKGSRLTQIISRDPSAPAPEVTYVASVKGLAPEVKQTSALPVATEQDKPAAIYTTDNNAPDVKAAAPGEVHDPVNSQVASADDTRSAPVKSEEPVAATASETVPVIIARPVSAAPAAKPVNIADEVAVEEVKPAKEEPQDEFSRLKARFDKVVYAPASSKTASAAPVSTKSAAPASTKASAPEQTATPALASAAGGKLYHTVKSGETAFGIAKQYGISMKELMAINGLNFEAIKIGQKLRVK